MTDSDQFQRRNRLFAMLTGVALAAIIGVVALTLVALAARWDAMTAPTVTRLALIWSPMLFYAWALWSLRQMFAGFAVAGPTFQPVLATALVRIAWALMLGAATTILLAPVVLTMTPPRPMGGHFAIFNVPALTLGVVGMALLATAHMLRRGLEIEAEARKVRSQLAEFF